MTRDEALDALRMLNPRAKEGVVQMYADAFLEYRSAQENIASYGTIVQHPRTGQPMPNPYLPIRDRAAATMRGMKLEDSALWA